MRDDRTAPVTIMITLGRFVPYRANEGHIPIYGNPNVTFKPSNAPKNRILRDIAQFGSLPFQKEACLQGTSEEYVLLDEF